ncbi:MAG: hypothetical protein R2788_16160 [Saprospiraceae bacterium]
MKRGSYRKNFLCKCSGQLLGFVPTFIPHTPASEPPKAVLIDFTLHFYGCIMQFNIIQAIAQPTSTAFAFLSEGALWR